jgi:ribosomal RNA-processing protein 17
VEPIDHEEEYIDEDRYTTVTVEEVGVSKDGLHTAAEDEEDELEGKKKAAAAAKAAKEAKANPKKQWPKKEKKKPFRYETKTERKIGRAKQKSSNKKAASARRGED